MPITRRHFLLGTGAVGLAAAGAIAVPMIKRPGEMRPIISRADPVAGDKDLPPQADAVIIGGGIIGVATAYMLAERGLSVVIVEKGEVACEQSSRAYGQVTPHGQAPQVAELVQHSKFLWRGMNAKLGEDTTYRSYGRIEALIDDETIDAERKWLAEAKQYAPAHAPLNGKFLEGAELARLIPGATSVWKTGLYVDDDGGIDPAYGAPAVARGAQKLGVKIITQCAARSFVTEGGRISGVVTEKGEIRSPLVLLAGGSWSRLMLGNAGIDLPILPVYLSQQRLNAPKGLEACGAANRAVWRKEADGSYSNGPRYMTAPLTRDSFELFFDFVPSLPSMLFSPTPVDFTIGSDLTNTLKLERKWKADQQSPFERMRMMAPTHNNDTLDLALDWLRDEFPAFSHAKVIERWAGTVDVTTDQIPIASAVEALPGLFVACGFTYGLTQGMGAGDLLACLMTGTTPKVDPAPYALSRLV